MASAQVLSYGKFLFLIDCAEATQLQLRKLKISPMRINHVFISHLHGDHYFGLMGLINSMHLMGRTDELKLFAPGALAGIIRSQLEASETHLRFPLIFQALEDVEFQKITSFMNLDVFAFPVRHRIPTWGFLFKELKTEPNIRPEFIARFHPHIEQLHAIKAGADFVDETGAVHKAEEMLMCHACRSYAYCTDTAFDEKIAANVKGSSLLYHEATFASKEAERARETYHSTAKEAATIARMAGVKRLAIGHFSLRYAESKPLVEEAKTIFPEVFSAEDGFTVDIE